MSVASWTFDLLPFPVVLPAGSYRFGPNDGQLRLDIKRDGLVKQAGHDLVMVVESWSAEATVAADLAASSLVVTADLRSLQVLEGRGGLLPLTERDKREILSTARKVLGADKQPELVWSSSSVMVRGRTITVEGELRLGDRTAPVELTIETDTASAVVRGEVRQSALGIKPYQAFFGALRVQDGVGVTAEVRLTS